MARDQDTQVVAAEIAGVTESSYRLWYRVPGDVVVDDLAMSHAFAVSVIHQAMAVGRDVEIGGPMTRGLLANLDEYQRIFTTWLPRRFRRVGIHGRELVDDELGRPGRGTIVPFSGGIDSLYSAMTLAAGGELGALVTVRGIGVPLADEARWRGVMTGARACAASLGRPIHEAATNWHEIASGLPGFLGYFLPVIATPMLFASRYDSTVMPSWYAYDELEFPTETSPLADPMLGRPGFAVRHHGAWARRIEKVAALANWPEALAHMRPCDDTAPDGTACRRCRKCVQSALLFGALRLPVPSALGGVVPTVEDVEAFEATPYALSALKDAVAAAAKRGVRDPWVAAAEHRLAEFGGEPAAVAEVEQLRKRLRYLLGGRTRTRFGATVRRAVRALRGRTGPKGLPELSRRPFERSRDGTAVRPVGEPVFATSSRGRRLYVDGNDWRGVSLIAHGGDLGPTTRRMWNLLLDAAPWTHVIDVGANYGEMLIDYDPAPGVRVVAVEPNPHVRRHLERSLREARRPVEIVAKAISDQDGRIELVVDRTWSGVSAVALDPRETRGHRVETIEVETVTLRTLLTDSRPDREKRVLVKVDVEGHEPAVLRGLGGAAHGYASFAALIEIDHLSDFDLAAMFESFTFEAFDAPRGTFVGIADRSLDEWRGRLAHDGVHGRDAVLRPRVG